MITFQNAEFPPWEQLKKLPLQAHIDSFEKFKEAFQAGYTSALDRIRDVNFPPGPVLLEEIHKRVFGDILKEGWMFRDNPQAIKTADGKTLCPEQEVQELLQRNAGECRMLYDNRNWQKAEMIARYQGNFMEIQPFKDNPDNLFVNRAIGAVVLEAQLEHAFRPEWIKREVNIREYDDALRAFDNGDQTKMVSLVKKMADKGYDVCRMDDYRGKVKNREHDHTQEY